MKGNGTAAHGDIRATSELLLSEHRAMVDRIVMKHTIIFEEKVWARHPALSQEDWLRQAHLSAAREEGRATAREEVRKDSASTLHVQSSAPVIRQLDAGGHLVSSDRLCKWADLLRSRGAQGGTRRRRGGAQRSDSLCERPLRLARVGANGAGVGEAWTRVHAFSCEVRRDLVRVPEEVT